MNNPKKEKSEQKESKKNSLAKQEEKNFIYGTKKWKKKRKPHQYDVVERNLFIHGDYIQLFALCEWQTFEKYRRHRNGFVDGDNDDDGGGGNGSSIETSK